MKVLTKDKHEGHGIDVADLTAYDIVMGRRLYLSGDVFGWYVAWIDKDMPIQQYEMINPNTFQTENRNCVKVKIRNLRKGATQWSQDEYFLPVDDLQQPNSSDNATAYDRAMAIIS